jgi:hypothetical protein
LEFEIVYTENQSTNSYRIIDFKVRGSSIDDSETQNSEETSLEETTK